MMEKPRHLPLLTGGLVQPDWHLLLCLPVKKLHARKRMSEQPEREDL